MYGLSGDTLNLGLIQEMEGKAVHTRQEHHVQSGVIDIYHLEFVGLKRVAKSSHTPHFRLITPSQ